MLQKAKTARLVITLYRHITDKLPTSYRHITNCRPTVGRLIVYVLGKTCQPSVGRQTADKRPTVGQQTADSRQTGFLGSSSSQLPWIFTVLYWEAINLWTLWFCYLKTWNLLKIAHTKHSKIHVLINCKGENHIEKKWTAKVTGSLFTWSLMWTSFTLTDFCDL